MKWLALFVFGGIGAAVLIAGLLWGFNRYTLHRNGRRAVGKIVSQEIEGPEADPNRPSNSDQSTFPRVEFETSGGEKIRFTGSTGGGSGPETQVGHPVEVIYDPANPRNAQIASFSQFWLGPVAISLFGAIFLAMGIAAFFLIRSSDRMFGFGTSRPEFQERVDRDLLLFQPDALRIRGQVTDLRPNPADGGKTSILTCAGRVAEGSAERRFHSDPVPAERAGSLVGRPVTVIIDPIDRSRYLVDLGPLLSGSVKPEAGP
jgi:hypothetical protein